jgi:hypothetical protein
MIKQQKLILVISFFLCFGYVIFVYADNSKLKHGIHAAERALAMLEVQNTMSKHAYYHAAGFHYEELKDLWVSMDGKYADTAKWSNPMGVWVGMDKIFQFYGEGKEETLWSNLESIHKIYPEIEVKEENLGIGGEWAMHTQTTAIIEIAGDGKTAKGIWYSPGIAQTVVLQDKDNDGIFDSTGKLGNWFWEKYGVDFVKENGKWKIWHLQTYYDNTPPEWGDEGERLQGGGGSVAPSYANPDPYEAWSATTKPRIHPLWPEPYYTFSDTFSY